MRPTTIITMIVGVLLAIFTAALGVYIFFNHSGGKLWFYWLAPLLALGAAAGSAFLTMMFYVKVGRVEMRGRPRVQ